MGIIEAIKAPKNLSFYHWRYRILHWVFNVGAKTPEESPLPNYLYTHYCPLFHLTNILFLLFPIIFCCKAAYSIGKSAYKLLGTKIKMPNIKAICKDEKILSKEDLQILVNKALTWVVNKNHTSYILGEDDVYSVVSPYAGYYLIYIQEKCPGISKERLAWALRYYENNVRQFVKNREQELILIRAQKDQNKGKFQFMVTTAESVVKVALKVLMVIGAAILLYIMYDLTMSTIANFAIVLYASLIFIIFAICIVGMVATLFYVAHCPATDIFFNAANNFIDYILGEIQKIIIGTANFFSEMYSNSCPPIVLEKDNTEEVPE